LIIWLNGTFGSGKTSTAAELTARLPGARLFDPEWVGYMLKANLADLEFTDFQQLPPWRRLVPVVLSEVASLTGQHLIAVQTVLVESYWEELRAGLAACSLDIFHVLLHADPAVLAQRIRADQVESRACQWRLEHLADYAAARPWMEAAADLVVDSTALSVADAAQTVAAAVVPALASSAQKASSGSSIGSSEVASAISRSAASRGSTVAAKNPATATLPW
jgi:adenylylsulfate kinase-like enzyme